MILLQQMIILFLIMGAGYFLGKKRILDEHVGKALSWMIVNISNPALIVSGSFGGGMKAQELFFLLFLASGIYAVLIIIAELLVPLIWRREGQNGIFKVLLVFSNIGFMGFPIISAVYGNESLLKASVFLIPFNILIYTYGIRQISGKKIEKGEIVGNFCNAGIIACLCALLISITGAGEKIPLLVQKTANMLGELTAPLSMMVIGASFHGMNVKKALRNKKIIFFTVIKMIILPVLGMLVIRHLVKNTATEGICMVLLATPSGSMAAMLAMEYDGDYKGASEVIALTTLLSVVTMPLVSWLCGV